MNAQALKDLEGELIATSQIWWVTFLKKYFQLRNDLQLKLGAQEVMFVKNDSSFEKIILMVKGDY
jgi:hypothetical protein